MKASPPSSPAEGERPAPGASSDSAAVAQALVASNRLLQALTQVQTAFIQGHPVPHLFDTLLSILLELTGSEYGFIGEVLRTAEGKPYLRTHAITNIAWTPELREFYAREAPRGMEFTNLKTLFGQVMVTGQPVVANTPAVDPRRGGLPQGHPPLNAFLGLPFHSSEEMVGMVGVANRAGGYDEAIITFLEPFLATCCSLLLGLRNERRRHTAEAEVRRSEASFRVLIEQSPDAILIHRGGRIVFANSTAVTLLGREHPEELLEQPLGVLVLTGHETALTEPSSASAPREVRFRHASGRQVLAEVVTVFLEFKGEPAIVCLARDITERRMVQARLLSTERLASLGTLAAGVAHEINTPLSYLLSNLNYVQEEFQALSQSGASIVDEHAQELHDALAEALSGSHRVRDIVRNLKLFSRVDNDQRGPVDIHALLDSCVKMAWSEIKHRARLVKEYGPVPSIESNESQLGQVFLNLLINAAQAIPEDAGESAEIRLSTWHEKETVVVAVQDTGVGIPEENLVRLFDPFFTTKPVGVGTGLGLSICHGIVAAQGGRITVSSQPGQGSTFQVYLPTPRVPPADSTHRESVQDTSSSSLSG
ncbi:ATP-binding protein [Hyalangium versicolor]|uniref:ATP-binding protein n=1 Tax=Hyalangium versicolor TaxID=2861190 RepID=UPI001CC91D74|nr:ATP-binding protein [Hyalangium versicolor]